MMHVAIAGARETAETRVTPVAIEASSRQGAPDGPSTTQSNVENMCLPLTAARSSRRGAQEWNVGGQQHRAASPGGLPLAASTGTPHSCIGYTRPWHLTGLYDAVLMLGRTPASSAWSVWPPQRTWSVAVLRAVYAAAFVSARTCVWPRLR